MSDYTCPQCGAPMTSVIPLWCPVPGVQLCLECMPPILDGPGSWAAAYTPCICDFGFIRYRQSGLRGYLRGLLKWLHWFVLGTLEE